jgi:hypothetical protein
MESDREEETETLWKSHPYLRLYEKDENNLRRSIRLAERREGHSGDPDKLSEWSDPQLYVVLRFFGTINGFHKVSHIHCFIAGSFESSEKIVGLFRSQRTTLRGTA